MRLTDKEGYFILSNLSGVGPAKIKQLITFFGSPTEILSASSQKLAFVQGIGGKLSGIIKNWEKEFDLEKELNKYEKAGIKIITMADKEYPEALREIYSPPTTLFVRGNADVLNNFRSALAVVGSRRTSRYGKNMCKMITRSASVAGWTIVSGLATGIDTVAHEATLDADGVTIAVLGSGLGHIYPQENVRMAAKIAEKGAVVSEFPILQKPDKRTFPMRNRIISGLCRGVLVVEAGFKSGSLITARHALEQNRQIFAIPGQVDNPHARGCHKLIKTGAKLTENFSDILEEFHFQGEFDFSTTNDSVDEENAEKKLPHNIQLSSMDKTLLKVLEENTSGLSAEELATETEIPTDELLSALLSLEMKKLISQLPGMRFALTKNYQIS